MRLALAGTALAAVVALTATGCSTTPPTATTASTTRPAGSATPTATATATAESSARALRALESEYDAWLGVMAVDTGSGRTVAFNADDRFGYASSLKALAAAVFLQRVPSADRDEHVEWAAADVERAGYSPVTEEHLADGLTAAELAEAAVRDSDNLAMNLVLDRIGGPEGLRRALVALGDTTTTPVHGEPELNTIAPGSSADTSTPRAFTLTLSAVAVGDALSSADRGILLDWMSGNARGDTLIRAGAPEGWTVADKSGGAGGIRNDVAVVTPPGRAPIVVTVFSERRDPDAEYDDTLVARAAEAALARFRASG